MIADDEAVLDKARDLLYEYFHMRNFDAAMGDYKNELKELPGVFAPPEGCFLLAYLGDDLVGCIAYKKLDQFAGNCEMKRLYVKPEHRGKKIGYRLIERLIEEAKKGGYTAVKLDNHPWMTEAESLYEVFGFKRIEPYWSNPTEGAKYFELDLKDI
jgi:GNAT superfamily N-acetyltransferase